VITEMLLLERSSLCNRVDRPKVSLLISVMKLLRNRIVSNCERSFRANCCGMIEVSELLERSSTVAVKNYSLGKAAIRLLLRYGTGGDLESRIESLRR